MNITRLLIIRAVMVASPAPNTPQPKQKIKIAFRQILKRLISRDTRNGKRAFPMARNMAEQLSSSERGKT